MSRHLGTFHRRRARWRLSFSFRRASCFDGRPRRDKEGIAVMISKPASAYDDAMRAVWRDVRVAALLAIAAFLLVIVPT